MGLITIMVTHRQELLTLTTKLLVLDEGRLRAFGGTAEVVERLKAAVQKRPAEQGRSA
jgi:ATP-binding cassette, subfamily C, bacterial exporter for protease/lipase